MSGEPTRTDWLGGLCLMGLLVAFLAAGDWIAGTGPSGSSPPVEIRVEGSNPATQPSDVAGPASLVPGSRPAASTLGVGGGDGAAVESVEEAGEIPAATARREARAEGAAVVGALSPESGREVVTRAEVHAALWRSPWPRHLRVTVVRIIDCEAGYGEYIHLGAVGAAGELGPLQIKPDVHPRLARAFDLHDLGEALVAGYVLWLESGRSFSPWSCAANGGS